MDLEHVGKSWGKKPVSTLKDPGGSTDDMFGSSVSAAGNSAFVGAPGTDDGAGVAYVYQV
jgi:hypothetical protein